MALGNNKAALELLDGAGDPPTPSLQARLRMDQGFAAFRLADLKRAEDLLSSARKLAEADASPLLVAEVELRQGGLWEGVGKFDQAESVLRHALGLASHAGDRFVQANIMGNLGYLFQIRFRYDAAIYWFQQSLQLSESIGAQNLSAATVGNLGSCYYQLGDLENAQANFEAAETRSARVGNSRMRQLWLGDSGTVSLDAEDYPLAMDRFRKALTIAKELSDKSSTALWLNNLARANILTGQLPAAEQYNNESTALDRDLNDPTAQLYDRLNLAEIAIGKQQFAPAEEQLLSIAVASSDDPTPGLQAQEDLARLYIQTAQPAKAQARFETAIDAIERRQAGLTKEEYKLSYLSSLVRFYRSYVDFLIQRADSDKALEVVESSRARILRERLTNAAAPAAFTAAQLQALAQSSHRVFLSYWLAPKQSYVWAITPAKIEMFKLPPEKEIRGLVESYRTAIEDLRDPLESQNPAGRGLSEILLGQVRGIAVPGSHVAIVPDGALHSLNFATLPAPGDSSKYWIEDVTLSVAPSLGLVLNPRRSSNPVPAGLLAIGDPDSPGQEFPRLPNARKELDTIAALFSNSSKSVYEGAQSQPSVYRRADPARFSFIHFAAHATANRASPLDSALILSREGNVYALTAREIMQVPLDATVVTLSSCRSAGARAYSGEGLVGLTWAFLQAGAHNVVAGLWDVDDASTSRLMSRMYSDLTRGMPPDDALRTAQLSLLHSRSPYSKPYYWGPFQLYTGAAARGALTSKVR